MAQNPVQYPSQDPLRALFQYPVQYPVQSHVAGGSDEYVARFTASLPVKHVIIDDFLDVEFVPGLHENPADSGVRDIFAGPDFARLISALAGREVFVDRDSFEGGFGPGGFDAADGGSFLDLHADSEQHPDHADWRRELTVVLYLNPGWEPSWGGELLLTDDPYEPAIAIEPRFNRLVVMECTERSFHGYQTLEFPPGEARRSIAAYAYSLVGAVPIEDGRTSDGPRAGGPVGRGRARQWIDSTRNRLRGSGPSRVRP